VTNVNIVVLTKPSVYKAYYINRHIYIGQVAIPDYAVIVHKIWTPKYYKTWTTLVDSKQKENIGIYNRTVKKWSYDSEAEKVDPKHFVWKNVKLKYRLW
jgi:hypothetical protein